MKYEQCFYQQTYVCEYGGKLKIRSTSLSTIRYISYHHHHSTTIRHRKASQQHPPPLQSFPSACPSIYLLPAFIPSCSFYQTQRKRRVGLSTTASDLHIGGTLATAAIVGTTFLVIVLVGLVAWRGMQ